LIFFKDNLDEVVKSAGKATNVEELGASYRALSARIALISQQYKEGKIDEINQDGKIIIPCIPSFDCDK